jgi:hypothetical protein
VSEQCSLHVSGRDVHSTKRFCVVQVLPRSEPLCRLTNALLVVRLNSPGNVRIRSCILYATGAEGGATTPPATGPMLSENRHSWHLQSGCQSKLARGEWRQANMPCRMWLGCCPLQSSTWIDPRHPRGTKATSPSDPQAPFESVMVASKRTQVSSTRKAGKITNFVANSMEVRTTPVINTKTARNALVIVYGTETH